MKHFVRRALTALCAALLLAGCSGQTGLGQPKELPDGWTWTTAVSNVTVSMPCPEPFHGSGETKLAEKYQPDAGRGLCLFTTPDAGASCALVLTQAVRNMKGESRPRMIASAAVRLFGEGADATFTSETLPNDKGCTVTRLQNAGKTAYTAEKNDVLYLFTWDGAPDSALEEVLRELTVDDGKLTFLYDPRTDDGPETHVYYSLLSDREREFYDAILAEINEDTAGQGRTLELPCGDPGDFYAVQTALAALREDHHELAQFLAWDVEYKGGVATVRESGVSNYAENRKQLPKIRALVDGIVSDMPKTLTRYGRYLYLAAAVRDAAWLDDSLTDEASQGIRGVFLDRAATGNGFADAFAYLCRRAGLFCQTVCTRDGNWSMIRLGGELYYLDVGQMARDGTEEAVPLRIDQLDREHKARLDTLTVPSQFESDAGVFRATGRLDWAKEQLVAMNT